MKKLYFLIVLFVIGSVKAQNPNDIVVIPDAVFKNWLLGASTGNTVAKNLSGSFFKIDANLDGEIQFSEAQNVSYLSVHTYSSPYIITLTGIENFTNLKYLNCTANNIEFLDVSMLANLEYLICANNELSELNVENLQHLKEIDAYANSLNSFDATSLVNLEKLILDGNSLFTLNVNGLQNLNYLDMWGNNLTTIDLNNLPNLKFLNCGNNSFATLDVSNLISLEDLFTTYNYLTNLNLSNLTNLREVNCSSGWLTSLNLDGLVNLKNLQCYDNNLSSLDISDLVSLEYFFCTDNQLEELDFTNLAALTYLQCDNNNLTSLDLQYCPITQLACYDNLLTSINLKNGADHESLNFNSNPLQYLCIDEDKVEQWEIWALNEDYDIVINSYCSFTPGGAFYTINGTHAFDINNNGCDASDIALPNLKFNITDGTTTGSVISNQSGEYSISVQGGTHTITPVLENPNYYTISTTAVNVTFPTETSPFTQNFCITPNGLHSDLEVAILPTTPARPGFDADYKLIIKNKGNIQQSGSISFAYDDTVLDYVNASPAFSTQVGGSLSWAFANLQPFETREINVTLNVNSPMETPVVNGDDILTYTATITSDQADELPLDNTFTLPQIVVNSFDPNDKTCLEGTSITPDMIGQYVHYMIRFENTGTFAAENIVVKDMIDTAKFDVSSLIASNGSHPYVTRITGNKVEFIFEGINLPFDDANNDGYVVFKIKTLPTLALGDSFSNTASIYFDFNHPIVTDPAVTTFAELGTKDFDFNNYFTLYPNPANGVLNINSKQNTELQSISIYNVLGQMVVSVPNAKGVNGVDVSNLSTGNYFIKIVSDKGTSNAKFIKQ